jgi:GDPmannose 4,6-dehydratase
MTEQTALIFGITGQDGAYLARLLLEKGYRVSGTTRALQSDPQNLRRLSVLERVRLIECQPIDPCSVAAAIAEAKADEIYFLSAQSSVWRSFQAPGETIASSVLGLTNVLEAVRQESPGSRILNAASGDCFGETTADAPATEKSPFRPRSPYAAAKCGAHHQLASHRLAYGQFACSAFLFNHESPLRSEAFATGKIVAAARRIAEGSDETLELGNVTVVRDWGWAPEYAAVMWRMLQQPEPRDFVIATGVSHPLSSFVEHCFSELGLDWREHVRTNSAPPRPSDITVHHADPSLAAEFLGWRAQVDLAEMAARLMRPSERLD